MQKELKVAHTHPFAEQGLFAAEASMQQELTRKLVLTLLLSKASMQLELTEKLVLTLSLNKASMPK